MLEGLTRNRWLSSALLNQLREHALGRCAADGVIEDSFGGLGRKVRRYTSRTLLSVAFSTSSSHSTGTPHSMRLAGDTSWNKRTGNGAAAT